MPVAKKVAICDYCNTRIALIVTPESPVELKCPACGAPLSKSEFVSASAQHKAQPMVQTLVPELSTRSPSTPNRASQLNDKYIDKRNGKYKNKHKKDRKCSADKHYSECKQSAYRKAEESFKRKTKYKHKSKRKSYSKSQSFGYWIKKAVDEIEDIFD